MKSQGINSIKIEQPKKLNNIMRKFAKPVFLIIHDDIAFFRNKPDTKRFRFTTNRCIETDTYFRNRFSEELEHSPVQYFRKFEAGLADGGCLKKFHPTKVTPDSASYYLQKTKSISTSNFKNLKQEQK
jgi:hypothetical protein